MHSNPVPAFKLELIVQALARIEVDGEKLNLQIVLGRCQVEPTFLRLRVRERTAPPATRSPPSQTVGAVVLRMNSGMRRDKPFGVPNHNALFRSRKETLTKSPANPSLTE